MSLRLKKLTMSEVCCSCLGKVWDTLEGKIAKRLTKKHGCSKCGAGRKLASGVSPEVVTNSNTNVNNSNLGNTNSNAGNKDSTVGNTNSNVGNSNAAVDNSNTYVDNSHTTVNNYPVKVSFE